MPGVSIQLLPYAAMVSARCWSEKMKRRFGWEGLDMAMVG